MFVTCIFDLVDDTHNYINTSFESKLLTTSTNVKDIKKHKTSRVDSTTRLQQLSL